MRLPVGCMGVHVALPVAAITLTVYGLLMRTAEVITIYHHVHNNETKPRTSDDGKYCILPFATSATDHGLSKVTLVTQGSIGYLGKLSISSSLWNGPVSAALYVPSQKMLMDALILLHSLSHCNSDFRRKVSAHLFYPVKTINRCEVSYHSYHFIERLKVNCTDLFSTLNSFPLKRVKWYPVNAARNIARKGATSQLLLIADIELYPSENLSQMFDEFYRNRSRPISTKEVFVVPVFELVLNETMPRTKAHLKELVANQKAVPFHIERLAYECHKIPGLNDWWNSGDITSAKISVYKSTKWIRPCWEPVFISDNNTPLHDERFRGYGKNKIQQLYEMCRQNYTFHILDNAFLVHYNISTLSISEWTEISDEVNMNNFVFQKFKREMDRKYVNESLRTYCNFQMNHGIPSYHVY